MADIESLTFAFVGAHPAEAAREVETLMPNERDALFGHLPVRLAAPVLGYMLPPIAARTVAALAPDQAHALLAVMSSQGAVAILRHLPDAERTRLIDGLPTVTAVATRLLLGYPEDSVGAWADPDVVVLPADAKAGDVLERARQPGGASGERVYVVNGAGRLAGVVDLPTLLRAPVDARLGTLAAPAPFVLPAVMPLSGALAHPAWRELAEVPVVERGDRPIGMLRRTVLVRAIEERARAGATKTSGSASFAGALASGYWRAISALIEASVKLLPPIELDRRPPHEH